MMRQRGISLIELMISLCLSSLMLTALLQHYLLIRQHCARAQSLLEKQNDMQLAAQLLQNTIRHAGFTPCARVDRLENRDTRNDRSLTGLSVGTDSSIHLFAMDARFSSVTESSAGTFETDSDNPYVKGDTVLLADCFHAEVQRIHSVYKNGRRSVVTLQNPLAFQYLPPTYLGVWHEEHFFIKKNSQDRAAMFYQSGHAEEITDTITQLRAHLSDDRVEVTLGLRTGESVTLQTRLRTP